MSSMYFRKDREVFFYSHYDADGKKRAFSLGTADKKTAASMKRKYDTELEGNPNALTMGDMPCSTALQRHIDYLSLDRSHNHVADVKRRCEGFLAHAGATTMKDITNRAVVNYLNYRATSTYSRSAKPKAKKKLRGVCDYNNTVAMVRSWLNWCVEQEYIKQNCFKGISKKRTETDRYALSDETLHKILQLAKKPENESLYPAIVAAVYTGMRVGDIRSLKWNSIYGELILVPNHKGGRPFPLYMHPELQKVVATLSRENEYVFSFVNHWKILPRILKAAGVTCSGRWHLFRHTIGSQMLERGAGLKTVSESLGHADVKTTSGYLHVTKRDSKKEAISLLPNYNAVLATDAEIVENDYRFTTKTCKSRNGEPAFANSPSL